MQFRAGEWLAAASIDPSVLSLRPDYRALVVLAENLTPGPSDPVSERLLTDAEQHARARFRVTPEHPHLAAWEDAFRAFGAKPRRTRPSVAALLGRLGEGLPRIDRLTDIYNAVSITHVVPVGGEDVDSYRGPLRLVRAAGDEPFDTAVGGEPVTGYPATGEVVWRDDEAVTCRRWNWRQCRRTRLTTGTTSAVFLFDALAPMTDDALHAAGVALVEGLRGSCPGVRLCTRFPATRAPGQSLTAASSITLVPQHQKCNIMSLSG